MEKRILPDFKSEAEEAKWWFDHQDELDKDFAQAAAEGQAWLWHCGAAWRHSHDDDSLRSRRHCAGPRTGEQARIEVSDLPQDAGA